MEAPRLSRSAEEQVGKRQDRRPALLTNPSLATLHEAAHELVALRCGCSDVHAFVRSPESGVCYHRLPPGERWDESIGEWRSDDLARVRARAAVSMAGGWPRRCSKAEMFPTTKRS
jgi:hypothetical protein